MSQLSMLTVILAGVLLILNMGMVLKPAVMRQGFHRFPRDRWSGRLLAVLAIFWSVWIVRTLPLGQFEYLKPMLLPAGVVLTGLVWFFMDELLAPRALGALLLLYPAPLLEAARLHLSPWSVLMSFLAYLMIIKGFALLLSPYLFRRYAEPFIETDTRCRLIGSIGLLIDIILLAFAFLIY